MDDVYRTRLWRFAKFCLFAAILTGAIAVSLAFGTSASAAAWAVFGVSMTFFGSAAACAELCRP